ncbi:hypothetical protein [Alteromonas sp. AMM-1]|jgi:hypothetical protein|uniref:hypothetical protein n=1 Tax=Alteromonas sp. AMM-1 TaxID=3394233 RepID=UPI0039A73ED0
MINYVLRKEQGNCDKWRRQAVEASEVSDYCRQETISAATQWLATPGGLLSSFALGVAKAQYSTDSNGAKSGRKRRALWRFAQTLARYQMV